jgi:hypothetical protein
MLRGRARRSYSYIVIINYIVIIVDKLAVASLTKASKEGQERPRKAKKGQERPRKAKKGQERPRKDQFTDSGLQRYKIAKRTPLSHVDTAT